MLYTVSSAVMAPDQGLIYAAAGPAPVSQRPYWAFELATAGPREDLAPIGGDICDPDADRAFACYRQAYAHWFEQHDGSAALARLERACALQPREALYAYMAGLLALDIRLPDQAIHWLNKALELGHASRERVAAFHLWRGRAYDAAGLRAAARADYRAAGAHGPDAHVASAAAKGMTRPWRWHRLALEFNYAEAL